MAPPPTPAAARGARRGAVRAARVHPPDRARRRLPRAERRAQLVRVAAAEFLEGGYDATTMEAVAEAAGVTRLIVYRIFGSKEALYHAVLTSVKRPLLERLDPPDLRTIVPIMVQVARDHPDAFRLLWRKARYDPNFTEQADVMRAIGTAFLDDVLAEALPDDLDREWVSRSIVEHVWSGVCTWLDIGDPVRDAEFARRVTDGAAALVVAWMKSARPGSPT